MRMVLASAATTALASDRGDMVRVEGPRRGARGAVHCGVVGAGRDGLPAEDTEEHAERSRHGTCRLEGEEGGVVMVLVVVVSDRFNVVVVVGVGVGMGWNCPYLVYTCYIAVGFCRL